MERYYDAAVDLRDMFIATAHLREMSDIHGMERFVIALEQLSKDKKERFCELIGAALYPNACDKRSATASGLAYLFAEAVGELDEKIAKHEGPCKIVFVSRQKGMVIDRGDEMTLDGLTKVADGTPDWDYAAYSVPADLHFAGRDIAFARRWGEFLGRYAVSPETSLA
jgi:hypothetical protein